MIELEKQIYNIYLRTLRLSQGKPFRLRKDFTSFEDNHNYPNIHKVSNLLGRCPHISITDYFRAPYEVYNNTEEDVYTLDFYASRKALGCYKRYMSIKEMEDPDEDHQLDFIRASLGFILKYCLDNKITFDQYLVHKKGLTYEWMKHYAERKISLYVLLESDYIYDSIMKVEEEHRKLLLGDLEERFYTIKGMYLKSKRAKRIVLRGTEIINKQTREIQKENE